MDNVLLERADYWQTSLFFCEYPGFAAQQQGFINAINKDGEQQKFAIASEVAQGAKHQLLESDLNFLAQNPKTFGQLQTFFESAVAMAAWELNHEHWPEGSEPNVTITESWYHISSAGAYHDIHQHPNCSWCGIFYIAEGDASLQGQNGVNRFYEPRPAVQYLDAGNAYLNNESYWDVAPNTGQLVIFPAYLRHSAMAYFGDAKRIVLAFNCQVNIGG